jgi:DNA invertase Pin-like site-specific DNA recombinase
MKIIAYLYSDPLLESVTDPVVWGWEVDQVYQDLGGRQQLRQLLDDSKAEPADYLLIRRLEELGDSLDEVSDRLLQIEALSIQIIATEQSYSSSQATDPIKGAKLRTDLLKLLSEQSPHPSRTRP